MSIVKMFTLILLLTISSSLSIHQRNKENCKPKQKDIVLECRFQGEGYYVTEDVWRDVEEFKLYFTQLKIHNQDNKIINHNQFR